MKESLLYYVALPYSEEVLNLVTFFSINVYDHGSFKPFSEGCGLFLYTKHLILEGINSKCEWLLQDKDAAQVLALYANKDFNGICEYLNTLPERPYNVYYGPASLNA